MGPLDVFHFSLSQRIRKLPAPGCVLINSEWIEQTDKKRTVNNISGIKQWYMLHEKDEQQRNERKNLKKSKNK